MARNLVPFLSRYIRYNSFIKGFTKTNSAYKIIVNSVPKSGTHLLMKALALTPGVERAPIQFGRQRIGLLPWCLLTCPSIYPVILSQFYAQKHALWPDELNKIPIDVDSPFYLSEEETRKIFRLIQPGWFAMGHLPYTQTLERIVVQEDVKMILILRDPRDVIISHANYLAQKSSHYMYPVYKALSEKERIMASIRGVSISTDHPGLLSIRERLESIITWMDHPQTCTIYFEKLIGPQGGGSFDAQIDELRTIAEHLEIEMSFDDLAHVADGIYGGTRTFRQGLSGRWKEEFDQEHRQACKALIGDFLVDFGYENDLDW